MNLEKERKIFEAWYEKAYMNTDVTDILMPNGQYSSRRMQHSWDAWLASASREGYKMVPVERLEEILKYADLCAKSNGNGYIETRCKAMLGAVE